MTDVSFFVRGGIVYADVYENGQLVTYVSPVKHRSETHAWRAIHTGRAQRLFYQGKFRPYGISFNAWRAQIMYNNITGEVIAVGARPGKAAHITQDNIEGIATVCKCAGAVYPSGAWILVADIDTGAHNHANFSKQCPPWVAVAFLRLLNA